MAGLVALVAIGLFSWVGQPWGTISNLSLLLMTLALAPLMLAFYELGGRTPTRLAQAAQASGWIAVLASGIAQALRIAGVVSFDYGVGPRGAFAIWAAATVVIGSWVAGANLLAGPWLGWVRWAGVVSGLGMVVLAIGLLFGSLSNPVAYVGGIGYQVVLPIWAFLIARQLRSRLWGRERPATA